MRINARPISRIKSKSSFASDSLWERIKHNLNISVADLSTNIKKAIRTTTGCVIGGRGAYHWFIGISTTI